MSFLKFGLIRLANNIAPATRSGDGNKGQTGKKRVNKKKKFTETPMRTRILLVKSGINMGNQASKVAVIVCCARDMS